MVIILFVQLYTSRVVLNILGVNDFGLWNVIASLIVSFSFISGPLTTSTQRFLNYDMGCGGKQLREIFSTSLLLFLLIGGILFLLFETLGVWFLNSYLNIASEKIYVAHCTFQFSILSFLAVFFRLPYESAIIAEEKMSFYAFLCIVESFLLLGIVYVLLLPGKIDKLILYGALTFLSKTVISLCYIFFCNSKIIYTKFRFKLNREKAGELMSFSGWNLFGAVAAASSTQGINILLNLFFGVVVNAAYGIASQVGAGVKSFISNFQKAVNPQIVKSYASLEIEYMHSLLCATGKYSFFLLFALVFPLILNMDWVLQVWLGGTVPVNTALFCKLVLVQMLIVCIGDTMDTAIFATGKIKYYQITLSCILLLNIIVPYCIFKVGWGTAIYALVVKCIVELAILIARLYFVHKKIGLSIWVYFKRTLIPIFVITIIMISLMSVVCNFHSFSTDWEGVMGECLFFYVGYIFCIWFIGIRKSERDKISLFVFNKVRRK